MPQDGTRQDLRRALLARRDALPAAARAHANEQLQQRLARYLAHRFGDVRRLKVGAYLTIGSEPDISPLFTAFGMTALPSVEQRDAPLTFLRYEAGMQMTRQALGVMVPTQRQLIRPDVLLVPCVGFQRRSDGVDRLGYGGGFYDRTLAAMQCPAIAIAFELSEISGFEVMPHDQPLDAVVTETAG